MPTEKKNPRSSLFLYKSHMTIAEAQGVPRVAVSKGKWCGPEKVRPKVPTFSGPHKFVIDS